MTDALRLQDYSGAFTMSGSSALESYELLNVVSAINDTGKSRRCLPAQIA